MSSSITFSRKGQFLLLLLTVNLLATHTKASNPSESIDEEWRQSRNLVDEQQESDEENTPSPDQVTPECLKSSDCNAMQICEISTGICVHKEVFPMSLQELLGSVIIIVMVGVGQAAGVGGGLVIVPLLMIFFGYEAKKSIAMVFVSIFSASIVNLVSFMRQRSPDSNGPMIDYKIVTISLPTIMIGSVYGVAFNKFLPYIAISILLVFFITQSLAKTYKSYKKQKLSEVAENKSHTQEMKVNKNINSPTPIPMEDLSAGAARAGTGAVGSAVRKHKNSNEQYPKDMLMKIGGVTIFFLLFSIVRGGRKFESVIGLEPCGFMYHLSNLVVLGLSYQMVKKIIQQISKSNREEDGLNEELTKGDDENALQQQQKQHMEQKKGLNENEMEGFAKAAFFAGLIGSIVGIGGGMVLVPKWLESGIPANKTAPCSITLLFLTAFNSFVQFSLAGVFRLDEVIYFSVISLISSFAVSSSISDYVKRTNQASLLILIILFFMVAALVIFSLLTYEKAQVDFNSLFEFGEFC